MFYFFNYLGNIVWKFDVSDLSLKKYIVNVYWLMPLVCLLNIYSYLIFTNIYLIFTNAY